jgi:hypothetical protein
MRDDGKGNKNLIIMTINHLLQDMEKYHQPPLIEVASKCKATIV